jgi:hypothetical protein
MALFSFPSRWEEPGTPTSLPTRLLYACHTNTHPSLPPSPPSLRSERRRRHVWDLLRPLVEESDAGHAPWPWGDGGGDPRVHGGGEALGEEGEGEGASHAFEKIGRIGGVCRRGRETRASPAPVPWESVAIRSGRVLHTDVFPNLSLLFPCFSSLLCLQVAEGYATTFSLVEMIEKLPRAHRAERTFPIIYNVKCILDGSCTPQEGVR